MGLFHSKNNNESDNTQSEINNNESPTLGKKSVDFSSAEPEIIVSNDLEPDVIKSEVINNLEPDVIESEVINNLEPEIIIPIIINDLDPDVIESEVINNLEPEVIMPIIINDLEPEVIEKIIINDLEPEVIESNMAPEIIDTSVITSQPKSNEPLLKYRASEYDIFDVKYAKALFNIFNRLPIDIKDSFNSNTEYLMSCKSINRFCLLNAIDDYEKIMPQVKQNYQWGIFSDNAFNYRPYQPW